jgi:hypothetical protein
MSKNALKLYLLKLKNWKKNLKLYHSSVFFFIYLFFFIVL